MNKKIIYPLLTLFLIVFTIEVLALLFVKFVDRGDFTQDSIVKTDRKRIVCIGESTTEGGYPEELQRKLDKIFPNKYTVYNLGKSGVTSLYFKQRIDKIISTYEPHYIISMLGINDTFEISKHRTKTDKSIVENLFLYKIFIYTKGIFSIDSQKSQALFLLNNGETERAYSLLLDVFDRDPTKLKKETLELLANYLNEESRNFNEALKVYNYLIKSNDNDIQMRIDRLWIYLELALLSEYKKEFETISNLGNQWNSSLAMISYLGENNPKVALKFFEKSKKEELTDEESATYSKLLIENGNLGKAKSLISFRLEKNKTVSKTLLSAKRLNIASDEKLYLKNIIESENSLLKKTTLDNYLFIVKKARKKGIGFYSMQYPMRSTLKLKEAMKPFLKDKSVRIIDNKLIFEKAVKEKGYDSVFSDSFAIDFGHMTKLGKSIIVENIVDAMDL